MTKINSYSTVLYTLSEEQFLTLQETLTKVEKLLSKQDKNEEVDLLTVSQTMKLFGCSRATLNNWKKKGVLLPQIVEGRVYYLKADCLKALKGYSMSQKGGKKNG